MKFLANWYEHVMKFLIDRGFDVDAYSNSLHTYGSFTLLIIFVGIFGMNVYVSAGVVFTLGIVKELFDWKVRDRVFSFADLFFDFVGILLGMLFCGAVVIK